MQPHKRPRYRKTNARLRRFRRDPVLVDVSLCVRGYSLAIRSRGRAAIHEAYDVISIVENLVFVGGACLLVRRRRPDTGGGIYAHLAAARGVYVGPFVVAELSMGRGNYSAGQLVRCF